MIAPEGWRGSSCRDRDAPSPCALGVLGGTFSGLTGVGGGAVIVPLLTGRIGLSQHRAHGTSLAIIMFVAAVGALPY